MSSFKKRTLAHEPWEAQKRVTKPCYDLPGFANLGFTPASPPNFVNPERHPLFAKLHRIVAPMYTSSGDARLRQLLNTANDANMRRFLLAHAIYYGHYSIVESFLKLNPVHAIAPLDWAAAYGRRNMFTHILRVAPHLQATTKAMDYAAANGHIDMVRFLNDAGYAGTTDAMDVAAGHGHLQVVTFLHTHRQEGCTTQAMNNAAANGHLEMLEYLHRERLEGATLVALHRAKSNGFMACVDWLERTLGLDASIPLPPPTTSQSDETVVTSLPIERLPQVECPEANDVDGDDDDCVVIPSRRDEFIEKAIAIIRCITLKRKKPLRAQEPYAQDRAMERMHMVLAPIYKKYGWSKLRPICQAIQELHLKRLVLYHAIKYGYKDAVQTILKQRLVPNAQPLDWAAAFGKIDMFLFIDGVGTETHRTDHTLDCAARNGHLDMVKLLHTRGYSCTHVAMDQAAAKARLDIVKYLHDHRSEGCTTHAMDAAAAAGRLEVVQFLHAKREEGCTTEAMDNAARRGHLHVLKFLHDHRSEGTTAQAMELAATKGHSNVVRWLHEVQGERIPPGSWSDSTEIGKYYVNHKRCTCNADVMDKAAAEGNIHFVRALHRRRKKCTVAAIDMAATNGHLAVVKFLHEKKKECTTAAMDGAIANGHLEVVKFLHAMRTEGFSKTALYDAIENGHTDVVQWIAMNGKPN
ncbi:Aste57867_9998 [Aphanomyces stellatus]|uniref:Aste57867_9998 protein n=1 Tax=Aphanomyces stellatus TaxID=120398 RepID=A0A485KPW1_9STRA|nr:hypothetical protein As57867_009959 [Aphanomyces stellatus]VFT86876.1 Aste57867_9998 [Aphanomyces stellatus]